MGLFSTTPPLGYRDEFNDPALRAIRAAAAAGGQPMPASAGERGDQGGVGPSGLGKEGVGSAVKAGAYTRPLLGST